MFKFKKQIYFILMLTAFIILNVNSAYATGVAVPVNVPILPFVPTGVPTGSNSTLIKALSGDPDAIEQIWNDLKTFRDNQSTIQETAAILTSAKIATFLSTVTEKFNGSDDTISSPVNGVSDISQSDMLKSYVADGISKDNELNRHLKGELTTKDEQAINEIQSNLIYDESTNTYTVGSSSSSNVYDVLDGLSDNAQSYFKNYQSQLLYNVSRSALTSAVFNHQMKVTDSTVSDFDTFVAKYNVPVFSTGYVLVRYLDLLDNEEKILKTSLKTTDSVYYSDWQHKFKDYQRGAKFYVNIYNEYNSLNIKFYAKCNDFNGYEIWYQDNIISDWLLNEGNNYIYDLQGNKIKDGGHLNFNDVNIKEIVVGGDTMAGNSFPVRLQDGFYKKISDTMVAKMTTEEVINVLNVPSSTDVLSFNTNGKKRPVIIPDINLENSQIIGTDIDLDTIDTSLDKAKEGVATLNPDVLNPTYEYVTNVTNNNTTINNNTVIGESFFSDLLSTFDTFLKNLFTINYAEIQEPFENFINLLMAKIPFLSTSVNLFNQIQNRLEDFNTVIPKPVITITLPSIGGGNEIVFTDLEVFDRYRDTLHSWIVLTGWLYVAFNITKRLPLILTT